MALVAGIVALGAAGPPAAGASSPPDADNVDANNPYGWFEAGREWRGDFADPTVVRVGDLYYAYATPTGGRYLPVLVSSDLQRWTAHPRWSRSAPPWDGGPDPRTDPAIPVEIRNAPLSSGDMWNLNDALVAPPSWALRRSRGPWIQADYWAPGVIQIGSTWFAYAAVKVSDSSDDPNGLGRFCITVATAPSPLGPFRDASGGSPIVCDVDPAGSIDPEPFRDPATGEVYLLWKAAGRRTTASTRGYPSALKAQRLGSDGRPEPGSAPVTLLTTNEGSWEGMTIENPSMVHWNGRYHLFYSGNSFLARSDGSSSYATGQAVCPHGPRAACVRVGGGGPLLASSGEVQGPGGASAFVDASGALRLAYSWYRLGENRTDAPIAHPRRLAVVQLVPRPDGSVEVGTAAPVPARGIDRACPPASGSAPFADVPASHPAARAVECVVDRGVAAGTGPTTYGPTQPVTRAQMATFVVRLFDAVGQPLPATSTDHFTDDEGSPHEANIDRLAAAGLVSGVGPGRYDPSGHVTRGQMTTFLARALQRLGAGSSSATDPFTDDRGSVHEPSTNAMAAIGVATGVVPGGFRPADPTSRAQMALFLARALDRFEETGGG